MDRLEAVQLLIEAIDAALWEGQASADQCEAALKTLGVTDSELGDWPKYYQRDNYEPTEP